MCSCPPLSLKQKRKNVWKPRGSSNSSVNNTRDSSPVYVEDATFLIQQSWWGPYFWTFAGKSSWWIWTLWLKIRPLQAGRWTGEMGTWKFPNCYLMFLLRISDLYLWQVGRPTYRISFHQTKNCRSISDISLFSCLHSLFSLFFNENLEP